MNIDQRIQELKQRRIDRDAAKEAYEQAEYRFKKWQAETKEAMEAAGIRHVRLDDGTSFTATETVYAQIQNRGEFVDWAKVHAPELVGERERKDLLNAEVRRALDDGDELPPGVGFYVREYIAQRAS